MYILGVHTGHDAAACVFKNNELVAYVKEERITRIKGDGRYFHLKAIDEALKIAGISRKELTAIALTRMHLPLSVYKFSKLSIKDKKRRIVNKVKNLSLARYLLKNKTTDASEYVCFEKLRAEFGVSENVDILFSNHHFCHILSSFKFIDWANDTLLLSCDGGGDGAQYSAYHYNGNELVELFGGEETITEAQQNEAASIGLAYSYATELCGFKRNSHEGKITGLAAFGKPVVASEVCKLFEISSCGRIYSKLTGKQGLEEQLDVVFSGLSKEEIAASIQKATETLLVSWVTALLNKTGSKKLALSGGVFSNVKLNYELSKLEQVQEIFVVPAMGDEGLPVGACVNYLLNLHGLQKLTRNRLDNVYFGFPYKASSLKELAIKTGFRFIEQQPALQAATLLSEHKVGAIFYGAMEMGPRALGARTILANPSKRDVNDSINNRLQRTEFMPFAPYVCDKDARDVFYIDEKIEYACRFMTVVTEVKEEWVDKIRAVVHIDGTARPQVVRRDDNPLYYDVLCEFKKITGLPVLVNTSFNAHEEPIINTPEEAIAALKENRVDFLVCDDGVVLRD